MEYLLGNFVNIPSRNGEIHIKIPLESKIVQSAAKDDLHMCLNSALSNLQIENTG